MAKLIVKSATMMAFVALLLATVALSGVSRASAAPAAGPDGGITYGKLNLTAYNAMQAGLGGISNASVAISSNSEVIVKGTTNQTGAFTSYVQQGVYTLQVSAQGFQRFTAEIKITAGQSTNVQAQLMPATVSFSTNPTPTPAPNTDPAPGVTAQGKLALKVFAIQSSSASPVLVQARVYVLDQTGAAVAKGTTNSVGIFETKLAAGSYKLLVQADGFKDTSLKVDIAMGKITEASALLAR